MGGTVDLHDCGQPRPHTTVDAQRPRLVPQCEVDYHVKAMNHVMLRGCYGAALLERWSVSATGHIMINISVSFQLDSNPSWIKANSNMTGFYRVHYDEENWRAIIEQLNTRHTVRDNIILLNY